THFREIRAWHDFSSRRHSASIHRSDSTLHRESRSRTSGRRWRCAMLRKWGTLAAMLGALAAGTAAADGHRGSSDYVYAKVVHVDPIVRYVTVRHPRRECWNEVVYERDRTRVAGPALAGGLIGGAIGRQFGGGSGRDALTLAGAIAGSAIATERAVRNRGSAVRETN